MKDGPPGEHLPIRAADEACAFIEANRERPFFVYLPFYSVHVPLGAPRELVQKYKAKAAALTAQGPTTGRERNSKVRLVQNHPTYAAMVESMDEAVGRVLDQLEKLDLADNTLVVFTSDNGGLSTAEGSPTSNLPYRAGKGWLYEGGIRVPTIMRWPGMAAGGSTCDSPITSTDYYPTFLEAAARPPEPDHLIDGKSFTHLLRGEAAKQRPIYWHYPHYGNQGGMPGGAVRDGRWKFIEWYEDGSLELYDIENDPHESKNLAKEHAEVAAKLRKLLDDWRREVGAKMPTPNPKYRPKLAG
jgi:arylsulfatase A-like enzyme